MMHYRKAIEGAELHGGRAVTFGVEIMSNSDNVF